MHLTVNFTRFFKKENIDYSLCIERSILIVF